MQFSIYGGDGTSTLNLLCRFMYMGVDIANERHRWSHVGFIFFSIVSTHYLIILWVRV
jgi:hypothetical protein